jgi:hypothetical protein
LRVIPQETPESLGSVDGASFMLHDGATASSVTSGRKFEQLLVFLFFLSLPLINPWIRGDGVGYYAFARAPLIDHSLNFEPDYLHANSGFREHRVDESGHVKAFYRTSTGHLDNHFSVGPAILWAPFLLLAHGAVLLARAAGSSVAADGFSAPYRLAMALATAVYGFLGLLLSFRLAGKYVHKQWALLATLGVWWASSLPVYMYFNPSWSHALSAFAVALFVWYWHETRPGRTPRQWLVLALITGLMLNVYFANVTLLVVLLVEAIPQYLAAFRTEQSRSLVVRALLFRHVTFTVIVLLCLFPTFLSRYIIYGNIFESGYIPLKNWFWRSPYFIAVLFSSNHGLFAWTPLLLFCAAGLFFFWRSQPRVGAAVLAAALAFYFLIACYPDWAGISSFGNRFFISLTALFVLGLAIVLDRFARLFRKPAAAMASATFLLACFVLWNLAFLFQWGAHLIPARGPISWSEMIHNQFLVVPRRISADLQHYLFRRGDMMQQIDQRDSEQLKQSNED